MRSEAKELYTHTKNRFEEDLKRIQECGKSIIAVRQVVKSSIDLYITDYCSKDTKPQDIFTEEDFQIVSDKIHEEIIQNEL
jgi:uncharacterized metal-binding protein